MIRARRPESIAAAALLALVLGACSPVAGPRAQTSPAPTPAGPTSTAASATSSPTPAPSPTGRSLAPLRAARASDLVVRVDALGETCCVSPAVVVTADGRLVTKAVDGALVERKLSAEGVQRLRNEVLGSGLFVSDRQMSLEPDLGVGPTPARGVAWRTFRVWNASRTVTVTSAVLAQAEEMYFKPSPERTQLGALAARLSAPESWLPATAWAVAAPKAYVPDGFRVVTSMEQVGGSQPDVAAVDWPFNTAITDLGEPLAASSGVIAPVGPGTRPLRCVTVDATDARAARDAFERAGAAVGDFPDGAYSTGLTWRAAGSGIVLFFQAVMPDQSSCTDAY